MLAKKETSSSTDGTGEQEIRGIKNSTEDSSLVETLTSQKTQYLKQIREFINAADNFIKQTNSSAKENCSHTTQSPNSTITIEEEITAPSLAPNVSNKSRQNQDLHNFLSNLKKLNPDDNLSEDDAKYVLELCTHVANSLKTQAFTFSSGLDSTGLHSTELNALVHNLSKRPVLHKVLMGAALVIVGCAALASFGLFLLGGSVILGAVAATQLATYTSLTAAALTGLGAGGVGLSLAAGIGLFNHTKPKLSDLAQSAKVCVENFSPDATSDLRPGA